MASLNKANIDAPHETRPFRLTAGWMSSLSATSPSAGPPSNPAGNGSRTSSRSRARHLAKPGPSLAVQNTKPCGNGSVGSSVNCEVPVIHARPVIVGTTAGVSPTVVSSTSRPTKRPPMKDSLTKS